MPAVAHVRFCPRVRFGFFALRIDGVEERGLGLHGSVLIRERQERSTRRRGSAAAQNGSFTPTIALLLIVPSGMVALST